MAAGRTSLRLSVRPSVRPSDRPRTDLAITCFGGFGGLGGFSFTHARPRSFSGGRADTVNHHRDRPGTFQGRIGSAVRRPSVVRPPPSFTRTRLRHRRRRRQRRRWVAPSPPLLPPSRGRSVALSGDKSRGGRPRPDCRALRLFALHRGVPFSGSDVSGIL